MAAIKFDHETLLKTYKVDDVVSNGLLPPEFVVTELMEAQMLP